jgi:hypothetical protein
MISLSTLRPMANQLSGDEIFVCAEAMVMVPPAISTIINRAWT